MPLINSARDFDRLKRSARNWISTNKQVAAGIAAALVFGAGFVAYSAGVPTHGVEAAGGFGIEQVGGGNSGGATSAKEPAEVTVNVVVSGDGAVSPGDNADSGGGAAANSSGLININTATESELQTLPGIGPATSEKIVADRNVNGPYRSVDDLQRVSGIGAKKVESLTGLVEAR